MAQQEKRKINFKQTFEMLGADPKKSLVFPLMPCGMSYAANHKKKRPAVVTIALPEQIVDEDLSALDNWRLLVLAYPNEKELVLEGMVEGRSKLQEIEVDVASEKEREN